MTDIVERLNKAEPCRENGGVCADMTAAGGCACATAADTITRLTSKNEKLRAALELYACGMNHLEYPHWCDGYPGGIMVSENVLDMGETARAALTQEKSDDR